MIEPYIVSLFPHDMNITGSEPYSTGLSPYDTEVETPLLQSESPFINCFESLTLCLKLQDLSLIQPASPLMTLR